MKPKLIIIRGNSGSGKSTVASKLHIKLGAKTMLVPQDVIRRQILNVKDTPQNPSIKLIQDTVIYGYQIGYNVILEGILTKHKYGNMLDELIMVFENNAYTYYFDLPFEETLRRHSYKPITDDYGEKEMRLWWNDKDYLKVNGEKSIATEMSEESIVNMIYTDIQQ